MSTGICYVYVVCCVDNQLGRSTLLNTRAVLKIGRLAAVAVDFSSLVDVELRFPILFL
jgi:hypothetical protein